MSRYPEEHVAELQWLEDGIHVIAGQIWFCLSVFAFGLCQLYCYWRR